MHLSNNTALAGYELPVALVERLVDDYPHVRVVNVSDPRVDELRAYVTRLVERFGRGSRCASAWSARSSRCTRSASRGVLCFEPNVAPRLVTEVWAALEAGRRPAIDALLRLNAALARGGNPRSLKAALAILGRDGGYLRAPYLPLTDGSRVPRSSNATYAIASRCGSLVCQRPKP